MSLKRGVGVYLILKECCFRVRVDANSNPNPNLNPKTAFFKKKGDPNRGFDPAFYCYPFNGACNYWMKCEYSL